MFDSGSRNLDDPGWRRRHSKRREKNPRACPRAELRRCGGVHSGECPVSVSALHPEVFYFTEFILLNFFEPTSIFSKNTNRFFFQFCNSLSDSLLLFFCGGWKMAVVVWVECEKKMVEIFFVWVEWICCFVWVVWVWAGFRYFST